MSAATPSKWGDLFVRTASAVVLVPVVIACIWLGGYWFSVFAGVLGCMIAHEWAGIVHPNNWVQYGLHIAAAVCGAFLAGYWGVGVAAAAVLGLAFLSGLLVRFGDSAKSQWSYMGVFYVGFPTLALILLRQGPNTGFAAILWVFLIVWSADILAYFAGRIIGGPKLAPRISPKKTWAGLAGAIAGSMLASFLFAHFMNLPGRFELALLAGMLAIVEQGGDLFESSLKRYYGVKDSGRLIPGHGGVIDRVDGLIAVVVAAAVIGVYRGHGTDTAQGLLLW